MSLIAQFRQSRLLCCLAHMYGTSPNVQGRSGMRLSRSSTGWSLASVMLSARQVHTARIGSSGGMPMKSVVMSPP